MAYIFFRLQIHPWETFENHLNEFSRIINYLKRNKTEIEYLNCEDMKSTYLKYNNVEFKKINF